MNLDIINLLLGGMGVSQPGKMNFCHETVIGIIHQDRQSSKQAQQSYHSTHIYSPEGFFCLYKMVVSMSHGLASLSHACKV